MAASNIVINWGLQILIEGLFLPLKWCVSLELGLYAICRPLLSLVYLPSVGVSSQKYVVPLLRLCRFAGIWVLVWRCLALLGQPGSLALLQLAAAAAGGLYLYVESWIGLLLRCGRSDELELLLGQHLRPIRYRISINMVFPLPLDR